MDSVKKNAPQANSERTSGEGWQVEWGWTDLLSLDPLSTCSVLGPTSTLSKSVPTTVLSSALQKATWLGKHQIQIPCLLTSKLSLPSASLSIMSKISSWIFSPCKRDQDRFCSFPTEHREELLKLSVKSSQTGSVVLCPGCHRASSISPCQ